MEDGDFLYGELADLSDNKKEINLGKYIATCLSDLQKLVPDIFENSVSVGISTIGLADQKKCALTRIARKRWVGENSSNIVEFIPIFENFLSVTGNIGIQNDAAAKCLAEYRWQDPNDKVESLFYAEFSEGVNGGFVKNGLPVAGVLHQELGHVYPRLNEFDHRSIFDINNSGCPSHIYCYEGVASNARIKNEWKYSLEVSQKRYKKMHGNQFQLKSPLSIISEYVANFCWMAALSASPHRILLGGDVIYDDLIAMARIIFDDLNKGLYRSYLSGELHPEDREKKPYLDYEEMRKDGFIRHQSIKSQKMSGILGSIEVARLSYFGMLHSASA